jgi:hypothetical protein
LLGSFFFSLILIYLPSGVNLQVLPEVYTICFGLLTRYDGRSWHLNFYYGIIHSCLLIMLVRLFKYVDAHAGRFMASKESADFVG